MNRLTATLPEQQAGAAKLDAAARPLFARASAAIRESRTLAALRNALLPKLISGDLRLSVTEPH